MDMGVFVCQTCSGIQCVSAMLYCRVASRAALLLPYLCQDSFAMPARHERRHCCPLCSRELGHRVKGVSMSNFTDAEADFLTQNGNKVRAAQH